jgi:hypothetical protein
VYVKVVGQNPSDIYQPRLKKIGTHFFSKFFERHFETSKIVHRRFIARACRFSFPEKPQWFL